MAQSNPVARGERIVAGECAMCHGIGRAEISPMRHAPTISEIARRSDFEALRTSRSQGILSGYPEMPKVALSPRDVEAILAYLTRIYERAERRRCEIVANQTIGSGYSEPPC
jgi:mono/diheme cytochrome c family protein